MLWNTSLNASQWCHEGEAVAEALGCAGFAGEMRGRGGGTGPEYSSFYFFVPLHTPRKKQGCLK